MRFFLCLSGVAIVAIASDATPTVHSVGAIPIRAQGRGEADFFGFKNGDLVGAILFQKAWISANPTEVCIVVVDGANVDAAVNGRRLLRGTALYSKEGRVYAHSEGYGNVLIEALVPADLSKGDIARYSETLSAALRGKGRREQVSSRGYAGDIDAICAEFNTVDAVFPGAGGRLAAAMADIGKDMGDQARGQARWMVFDWCIWHCFYNPEVGVLAEKIPSNPLTKRPYVCGQGAEMVECAVFAGDWRKAFPKENARMVVVVGPGNRAMAVNPKAFTAYTDKGLVGIFSTELGSCALDGVTADVFDKNEALCEAYAKLLAARKDSTQSIPSALLGDSPALVARRAMNRLLEHNNNTNFTPNRDHQQVISTFSAPYVFSYNATDKSARLLGRRTPSEALPNRLIAGIVNAKRFIAKNPEAKVVIVSALENGHKIRSYALASSAGKIAVLTDNLDLSVDVPDIKTSLTETQPSALFMAVRHLSIPNRGAAAKSIPTNVSFADPRALITTVSKALTDAGVPFETLSTSTEVWPDGSMRKFAIPSLTFVLCGHNYTFSADESCQESDGVLFRD